MRTWLDVAWYALAWLCVAAAATGLAWGLWRLIVTRRKV